MARRRYIHLAGDLSGYPKGFAPSPTWGRNLDQYASELVNAEDGGSWAPLDPIVVGPRGTPTISLQTAGSVLSGNVETVKGNGLDKTVDAVPGLVLTSSVGGPPFVTARTRDVVVGFSCFTSGDLSGTIPISFAGYAIDPLTLGAQCDPYLDALAHSHLHIVNVPFPVRAQHRSSTISSVDFRVLIAAGYAAVPAQPMRFRVCRVRGNAIASLHTNAGGYDADGWFADTAATVAAFTNNGAVRTLTYTPDQNNVGIDPTTDYFMLQARGASVFAGSIFLSAVVHLTNIVDMRQE